MDRSTGMKALAAGWAASAALGLTHLVGGVILAGLDPLQERWPAGTVWADVLRNPWPGLVLVAVALILAVVAAFADHGAGDYPIGGEPRRRRRAQAGLTVIGVIVPVLSASAMWFLLGPVLSEGPGHRLLTNGPPLFVLIGTLGVVVVLILVAGRLRDRARWYPPNLADVPEPARQIAASTDAVWHVTIRALLGGAAGAVAALFWAQDAWGWILPLIAIVGLLLLALLAWGVDQSEARFGQALRHRIARVRAEVEPVRAEVTAVSHEHDDTRGLPDVVSFTVTVRWTDDDDRTRTATDTVYARAADAPVVGGTVLVWSVGERAADHYLEPDPESERDPFSAGRYQRPAS